MEKIHKVPGLEGMTLEIARTLLTRPRRWPPQSVSTAWRGEASKAYTDTWCRPP